MEASQGNLWKLWGELTLTSAEESNKDRPCLKQGGRQGLTSEVALDTWCSMHESAFKCMYICVSCVYACTCKVCVHVCSVACVSRANVSTYVKAENKPGAPSGRLSPYFEKGLWLTWSLLIQLDWLDSKLQGSFCLNFPSMLGLQLLSTFDEAGIHVGEIL